MPSTAGVVVVLGTGGTIAGAAAAGSAAAGSHVGYQAAVRSVADLVVGLPGLRGQALECESVAQIDSCDMALSIWLALRRALMRNLARPEVAGVVVTHGTDTLEETAYFLHRTLPAPKPVVLTAAMRPADAASPDGPQNLLDALRVAREPGARGVVTVMAGQVLSAADVRKVHGYRVDAFSAGDAGPLAVLEDGALRLFRPWPQTALHAADPEAAAPESWPVVDIVTSHAGARGATVDALVAAGARGIVIAGTGNGSVHAALAEAAQRAMAAGVRVRRASRCVLGGVISATAKDAAHTLPTYGALTAQQARLELMLDLLTARVSAAPA
jgi:L-asparaginase